MNKEILQLIEKRLDVGAKKYGLELDPFDERDWIQETIEELLDACVYLAAELIEIQNTKNKNNIKIQDTMQEDERLVFEEQFKNE